MDGEPIDLLTEYGRRLVHRWEHHGVGPWDHAHAYVGQLADGRWYADRTELGPSNVRAYPDEETALEAARRLMADREGWTKVEPHPSLLRPRSGAEHE
jgi:hypothetical protein